MGSERRDLKCAVLRSHHIGARAAGQMESLRMAAYDPQTGVEEDGAAPIVSGQYVRNLKSVLVTGGSVCGRWRWFMGPGRVRQGSREGFFTQKMNCGAVWDKCEVVASFWPVMSDGLYINISVKCL